MARRRSPKDDTHIFRVFLDEGVPVSVGSIFEESGYRAIRHGELLQQGASDSRVATAAQIAGAVLVAVDNDMKRLSGRYGSADPRYATLNLIKIACSEPLAASRIKQAMSLIALEWRYACEKPSRRLYLEIGPHHIRTFR